ncbi:hypothetical protein EYF80_012190 [Liparis tanakae]|uniref:Uncharacterized protein n=1 Tax=Liparis tanakae TaxID=230148 RepID=A0A4Z2IHZ3_9TELE|nr:hypothetical protein EYF80_012190 [Liparis tanakae]
MAFSLLDHLTNGWLALSSSRHIVICSMLAAWLSLTVFCFSHMSSRVRPFFSSSSLLMADTLSSSS